MSSLSLESTFSTPAKSNARSMNDPSQYPPSAAPQMQQMQSMFLGIDAGSAATSNGAVGYNPFLLASTFGMRQDPSATATDNSQQSLMYIWSVKGYMVRFTKGDGRCMYRAFAKASNEGAPLDPEQETEEADRLRDIGVLAMGGDARNLLEGTQHMNANESIEDRMHRMRRPDEFAELAEVVALSVAERRSVTVLVHRRRHSVDYNTVYTLEDLEPVLEFDPPQRHPTANRIFLFHEDRHYSAVRLVTWPPEEGLPGEMEWGSLRPDAAIEGQEILPRMMAGMEELGFVTQDDEVWRAFVSLCLSLSRHMFYFCSNPLSHSPPLPPSLLPAASPLVARTFFSKLSHSCFV
jgi:hypothetical protein